MQNQRGQFQSSILVLRMFLELKTNLFKYTNDEWLYAYIFKVTEK